MDAAGNRQRDFHYRRRRRTSRDKAGHRRSQYTPGGVQRAVVTPICHGIGPVLFGFGSWGPEWNHRSQRGWWPHTGVHTEDFEVPKSRASLARPQLQPKTGPETPASRWDGTWSATKSISTRTKRGGVAILHPTSENVKKHQYQHEGAGFVAAGVRQKRYDLTVVSLYLNNKEGITGPTNSVV